MRCGEGGGDMREVGAVVVEAGAPVVDGEGEEREAGCARTWMKAGKGR